MYVLSFNIVKNIMKYIKYTYENDKLLFIDKKWEACKGIVYLLSHCKVVLL